MTPLPTMTGRPRRRGSRACSTDAKNASMSRWSTRSAIEHHRRQAPRQFVRIKAQFEHVARVDRTGEVVERLAAHAILPARVDPRDAMTLGAPTKDDRGGLPPGEVRADADGLVQFLDAHADLRCFQ